MTRLFFYLMAAVFMMMGLFGVYLIMAWGITFIDPLWQYPGRAVIDRNGVIYPLLLVFVGIVAYLFYGSFLRHNRGTANGGTVDRMTRAMKDSW